MEWSESIRFRVSLANESRVIGFRGVFVSIVENGVLIKIIPPRNIMTARIIIRILPLMKKITKIIIMAIYKNKS